MSRSRYAVDYQRLAKGGFALGAALFVIGAIGAIVTHAAVDTVPGWLDTLLFDLEAVGLLVGFVSPILFGIVMPLTD